MKKLLLTFLIVSSLSSLVKAQTSYDGALGLGIDLIGDFTFVGAGGKYFFSEKHVGQAHLGFEQNATIITALYSFHKEILGARGLRWYTGVGPSIIFLDGDNTFSLRPHAGLDFKFDGVPIVLNFDWRPAVILSNSGDNEVGSFGFGILFAFN
ncbi:MAG: hypothetical protein AAGC43_06575 [Bacteroidota bacterium]